EHTTEAFDGLPLATALAFEATGAVSVVWDSGGRFRLKASSKVGLVAAGGSQLAVRPKGTVGRLLWMLGHASNPAGWRDEDDVTLYEHDELDDPVTGLAVGFAHRAIRAISEGVLHGYQEVDEHSLVLRGRLREADQMRRRLGVAI